MPIQDSMRIIRKLLVVLAVVVVALAGLYFYALRGHPTDRPISATEGSDVTLVDPSQEKIPTINILKPLGWPAGQGPKAAAGLTVTRFAEGLSHPRTMLTLPNGDVLVAETDHPPSQGGGGGLMGAIQRFFWRKAGAGVPSPNEIVLLRDANGDGLAEQRFILRRDGLDSPSGMAWGAGKLYVANHNAVLSFDFQPGQTAVTGAPTKIADLPAAGNHWMRNLILSADGKLLYVAVGSSSNIGENGLEAEEGRAAIHEITLATGRKRQFAAGLRNPNGLDWNPATGELWTTVNERDMLGGDLVPDYLTNVPIGAHYGWPWYYWKKYQDDRVDLPIPQYLSEYVRKPEYALGAHTASLGLQFVRAGTRLGAQFSNGAIVARHGSWNRKPVSGYDVVFIPFDAQGNPKGQPVPILSGFVKDKGAVYGRPVWVAFDKLGALLVSDDTGGVIWRVIAPNAQPSVGVKAIPAGTPPPKRELDGAAEAQIRRQLEAAFGSQ